MSKRRKRLGKGSEKPVIRTRGPKATSTRHKGIRRKKAVLSAKADRTASPAKRKSPRKASTPTKGPKGVIKPKPNAGVAAAHSMEPSKKAASHDHILKSRALILYGSDGSVKSRDLATIPGAATTQRRELIPLHQAPSPERRNKIPPPPLRAIDLYSGVGGWTLGLRMAGISVLHSFEWWDKANLTHHLNFGSGHKECDVRKLDLSSLPKGVDVVVGSPPCTQFSYANRGGSGNIPDGLNDIEAFLNVVEHLRPKYWAMENVPRVAKILESEIRSGGSLHRFQHLVKCIDVFDLSHFGVPQQRKRMIAGDFPLEILRSYAGILGRLTLGEVLRALKEAGRLIQDPIYKNLILPRGQVTELEREQPLEDEEARLNEDAKTFHPVYNKMSFPDRLDRPARTITALCTRVSRESIVVPAADDTDAVRRLSLRESACLQGFPISFQFYGDSHGEKQTMIGNALPPPAAFLIATAIQSERSGERIMPRLNYPLPHQMPVVTHPDRNGSKYPPTRTFWAAIPNVRFGSGVRLDLKNEFVDGRVRWVCRFYYGTSKQTECLEPSSGLTDRLLRELRGKGVRFSPRPLQASVHRILRDCPDGETLQALWTHKQPRNGHRGPYQLIDQIGRTVLTVAKKLSRAVLDGMSAVIQRMTGIGKKALTCAHTFLGLLAGNLINDRFLPNRARTSKRTEAHPSSVTSSLFQPAL